MEAPWDFRQDEKVSGRLLRVLLLEQILANERELEPITWTVGKTKVGGEVRGNALNGPYVTKLSIEADAPVEVEG
jgi:hypothetical protein